MYRPPPKRRLLVQRVAVYAAMSLATLLLVAALLLVMLGYQFNRTDGKIEQGGLVQFDSRPSGADVIVDGNSLPGRTASKTTMTSGQHFVEMKRAGYQAWRKSIEVVPGSVLWLNYARLIPNELAVARVAQFESVSSATTSPDNKWMAVKENPSTPVIRLADLAQGTVKFADIALPATSYTPPSAGMSHSFQLEKWAPNNRYLLVKHTYDDTKTEWLLVDSARPEATKNITTLLGVDIDKIVFSDNSSSMLYALIDANVRKIDIEAVTLSGPLVTNVADFALYDQTIITYVTLLDPTTKTRTVGYYHDGARQPRTVRSYTDDGTTPLHFRVGRYFNDTYAAIAYGENLEILQGELSRSDAEQPPEMRPTASTTITGGARYLSTKTNNRFVVAQSEAAYTVYDLELKKVTTTPVKNMSGTAKELDWLDDYMLWSDGGGVLRFYEFDGANQHDIMPIVPGFDATLSPNGEFVYGIVKAEDGTLHLGRVRLVLN